MFADFQILMPKMNVLQEPLMIWLSVYKQSWQAEGFGCD